MKLNDKAIEAARKAYCEAAVSPMEMALEAAYAAQFPTSEEYAGLVKQLRNWGAMNYQICDEAADTLKAVLAERDALLAVNAELSVAFKERDDAIAERDALLARLAPVDDEALVEIALRDAKEKYGFYVWATENKAFKDLYALKLRAAIAAIRPHIEAAERERCAKTCRELDKRAEKAGVAYPSGHVCALEIMKSPQQTGVENEIS